MPAPFTARRNASTLHLGIDELHNQRQSRCDTAQEQNLESAPTTFWQTEYDSEFAGKLELDVAEHVPHQRPSPATPRSLKKGFVHFSDYEKMDSQFHEARLQSERMHSRLMAARSMMEVWQADDAALISGVEQEHEILGRMGRSMGEAATSMQQLLGLMEQNRQVMAAIAKGHGISGREPAKGGLKASAMPRVDWKDQGRATVASSVDEEHEEEEEEQQQQQQVDPLKEQLRKMEAELSELVSTVKHLAVQPSEGAATRKGSSGYRAGSGRPGSEGRRSIGRNHFVERIETYPLLKTNKGPMTGEKPWI